MTAPNLRDCFPHAVSLTVHGHQTLQDADFNPGCGYVSQQEAEILYETARDFPGLWYEIGSHTGWSGAYIASGCGELLAVEPMFCHAGFFRRARENWQRAGVWDRVLPVAQRSDVFFAEGGASDVTFHGGFIDGDHEPGKPLLDAMMLLPRMAERCAICFHDAVGQPVVEAAEWVESQGFTMTVHETMARLVVCVRG